MSYDLYLLRRDEVGDDPTEAYERLTELKERQPSAEEEAQLRRLAADLEAAEAADVHAYVRDRAFEKYGAPAAPPWWKRLFGAR